MTSLKQIQQEFQQNAPLSLPEGTVYEQFQASGLIGCVSVKEDLSTTYKQVLAEEWGKKYDQRDVNTYRWKNTNPFQNLLDLP